VGEVRARIVRARLDAWDVTDRGILIDGQIIPGTERVIRDPGAWWQAGRETRPRAGSPIDMLIGHWTGGSTRTGPGAGRVLVRHMDARRGSDGVSDLSVSIHFGIAWDGGIWQCLDLAHGAVHVGHRPTIRRSIGVECMWPGTVRQAERLGSEGRIVRRQIDGRLVACLAPSDEMLDAWRWLAEALTSPAARAAGITIPRRTLGLRRTLQWLAACGGGVGEHATLPRASDPRRVKIDACGLLLDALGWPTVTE
jgi:hypothetical protein